MAIDIPESLRELASMQCGVVSRPQVFNAGVTKSALSWQLRRAHWQQLQRGVFALFSGAPSREADLWAAVLRAGPGAVLSHHTAAELHRLTGRSSDLVHVTVPGHRRVQPIPGFAIHLSDSVDRTRHPGLLPPRTKIEDTVLDLANLASTFDDACGRVTRSFGRRLTTEQHVPTALAARSRQRWRVPLTQMLTEPGGVHSVLEFRYYRHVERAHRLPPATRQVRVAGARRIAYRDAYYAKYQVIVELDGQIAP